MSLPTHSVPRGDKPPFRIRPARRGDVEALSALLRELGFPAGADTSTVHWVLSHPEIEVFVAGDAQDKPIGMISLAHRPQLRLRGRILCVDELVVTEAWRRKGVGRELLRHALERARSLSAKQVDLYAATPKGEPLRTFYEGCGFSETAELVLRIVDPSARR